MAESIRQRTLKAHVAKLEAEVQEIFKALESDPAELLEGLLHRGVDVDDIGPEMIAFTVPGTNRHYEWHLCSVTDDEGNEVDESVLESVSS